MSISFASDSFPALVTSTGVDWDTGNMNHRGEYDFEHLDIGLYQEESTPIDPVIMDNAVSDGMISIM